MTENNTATSEHAAEEVTAQEIVVDDPNDPTPLGADEKKGGVRQKITDLEAERDGLTAALAAAHGQHFDRVVTGLGLQPQLMRAAGVNVTDHLTDDGTVDIEALTAAVDAKRAELGLPRKPAPNPLAGVNRDGLNAPDKRSLGEVLKSVTRPS